MRGWARWPDRPIARHGRHRRGRRATRRPTPRPRRSLPEGHLATTGLFQIDADGLPSEFPPLGTRTAAGAIATLLAIDLAGWHRVMREIGDDGAAAAAAAYHRIVAETAHANDGLEVERVADWSMCVFSSPKSALLAATAIRSELRTSDWIQVN